MSEMRIARFVNLAACRSIFSEGSTFLLHSVEHYRRLFESNGCDQQRGDRDEMRAKYLGGGGGEVSCFLLSCWTILGGDVPTPEEWALFDDSIVAIVSTPSRVSSLLTKAFETTDAKERRRLRSPFLFLKHKRVRYADEVEPMTQDNIMDEAPFQKRLRFKREKEYRFALAYSRCLHTIDTYIFEWSPDDYVDTSWVNPERTKEDRRKLLGIIDTARAGYGHFTGKEMSEIIANADILF